MSNQLFANLFRFRRGLTPRWRRTHAGRLLRQPKAWWTAAILLGLFTFATARSTTANADRHQAAWGSTQEVWQATQDIGAGSSIDVRNVRQLSLPALAVPPDPFVADPVDAIARETIRNGDILTTIRVGSINDGAGLPANTSALSLRAGDSADLLQPGDIVDIWMTFDPFIAPNRAASERIASTAQVIDISGSTVLVAVANAEVPSVTMALAQGQPTLAIVGRAPVD